MSCLWVPTAAHTFFVSLEDGTDLLHFPFFNMFLHQSVKVDLQTQIVNTLDKHVADHMSMIPWKTIASAFRRWSSAAIK